MFFERPTSGELAVLVRLDLHRPGSSPDWNEFTELVLSAGGDPIAMVGGSRQTPDPRHFVGSGKLDEIRAAVEAHQAKLVIFDHDLSPSQERNIEKALSCRVVDRTGLILDIFAQRARTHEGKLQVELAQLQHASTRLVRGWTHLERQKGGIGMRGPGETQLETDRRLIRARIRSIEAKLEKVRSQREQGRRARTRNTVPTVSLVGYTNTGKSTLFNRLSQATVYAADQLFATLDPTMRRIQLPHTGNTVLADTVGFIRQLPHQLVDAFRSTLEEAVNADLLLHVVDAAAADRDEQIKQVEVVLKEIGADTNPCLLVLNKIDLTGLPPRLDYDETGKPCKVWVSAKTGAGMNELLQALDALLAQDLFHGRIHLPAHATRARARLFARQAVLAETHDDDGSVLLDIRLPVKDWRQFLHSEQLSADAVVIADADSRDQTGNMPHYKHSGEHHGLE